MSRCDELSIPTEIKAEITDISSQDEANDSSLASLDNKAFWNLGNLFNPTTTTTTTTRRPYPLNYNYVNNAYNPTPTIPYVTVAAPVPTITKEISETVKFVVTIPPAKNNKLAENKFKTPFRPSHPIELELKHVKPTTTTPRLPAVNSGYGFMKEGDDQPME